MGERSIEHDARRVSQFHISESYFPAHVEIKGCSFPGTAFFICRLPQNTRLEKPRKTPELRGTLFLPILLSYEHVTTRKTGQNACYSMSGVLLE